MRPPLARLTTLASGLWRGPGTLSRPLRLEWRLVLGRWLAIAFVSAGLHRYNLPFAEAAAAYAVIGLAFLYSLLLLQLIRRQHRVVVSGVLPTLGDAVLCAAMFPIVGGFDSPFAALLYLVLISVGIRFGLITGALAVLFIGVADGLSHAIDGHPLDTAYMVRTGVLLGTILVTSILHDETRKSEAELAERLRQANKLNGALQHQAMHDSLTGLANRVMLHSEICKALDAAEATQRFGGLLLFDLDRFKEVNDSLGHPVGDTLLKVVGQRLAHRVRATDIVSRLGGDEFAVLLPDADADEIVGAASRLREALREPVTIEGNTINVGASVGIAMFPEHGTDADDLLRHADVAMYTAKHSGAEFELYDPDRDDSQLRLTLAGELRHALDGDELVLHYQPKMDINRGDVVGVEALVRWEHPQRGLLGPNQFIPLAEQTGVMDLLSRKVIQLAMKQAGTWRSSGQRIPIAINLSARDLNTGLPELIQRELLRYGVHPGDIEVEVTETMLIGDPAQAAQTLSALGRMGIKAAIDDFGTGYSSLAYLKQLPVSTVKIDRSFVQGMTTDRGDLAIVGAAIDLAHRLGMLVVAEGVETAAELNLLRDLECDQAQGFGIARPKPAADLDLGTPALARSEPHRIRSAA